MPSKVRYYVQEHLSQVPHNYKVMPSKFYNNISTNISKFKHLISAMPNWFAIIAMQAITTKITQLQKGKRGHQNHARTWEIHPKLSCQWSLTINTFLNTLTPYKIETFRRKKQGKRFLNSQPTASSRNNWTCKTSHALLANYELRTLLSSYTKTCFRQVSTTIQVMQSTNKIQL